MASRSTLWGAFLVELNGNGAAVMGLSLGFAHGPLQREGTWSKCENGSAWTRRVGRSARNACSHEQDRVAAVGGSCSCGPQKKSISSGTWQAHVPHTLIQKFSERLQHFLHAAASLCSPAYAPLTQLNQAAFVINPRSVFYDLSYFLPGIFFDIHHAIPTIRVYSVPAAKTTQISRGGMNQSTNIMYVCMCMCMCMYLCAYL